ncbi:hypothetical protein EC973_001076 [Apophysomyces ossiformis]|uniref:Uncharacterized protein n=1 Tax=Apophysomyces ossiformis TaxID=679940 RepID=A0A8H7ENU3_9FUNG|nr:hypothetical protein EC973_001076 [Apophysomyces ossiformis]
MQLQEHSRSDNPPSLSLVVSTTRDLKMQNVLIRTVGVADTPEKARSVKSSVVNVRDTQEDLAFTAPREVSISASFSSKKASSEMKHLSAETTWKRVQAEVSRERNQAERLYNRRTLVYQQAIQLQDKIQVLAEKKKAAISSEDYSAADTAHAQQKKLKEKLDHLTFTEMDKLNQEIHQSWKNIERLVTEEVEAVKALSEACGEEKEDRLNQMMKFNIDNESFHEKTLQQVNTQRADIEKEKSEIAFEIEMWEQSHAEFRDSLNDIARDERFKKEELIVKMDGIQIEIDELTNRLDKLRQQYKEYQSQIGELDAEIENATKEYAPEQEQYDAEWKAIQKRKQNIEARSADLDWKDADIQRQMEKQVQTRKRGEAEIEALQKRIRMASERASHGRKEIQEISSVFVDIIKARDQSISLKKQELSKVRQQLKECSKSVDTMQSQIILSQQRLEELDGSISHAKLQLASLERQKKVAAEMGQFQQAAKITANIKSMISKLEKVQQSRQSQQAQVETDEAAMHEKMEMFKTAKRTFKQTEHQTAFDIIAILENSKAELTNISLSAASTPQLNFLVEAELASLDLCIESMRCCFKLSKKSETETAGLLLEDNGEPFTNKDLI